MPIVSATLEAEIQRIKVQGQSEQKLARSHLNQQAGHNGVHCNPSYMGGISRRIAV
jgi:hypothetical protein